MMSFREEKDSLGAVAVPENAYYGAQTQRAVDNFPDSGIRMPSAFIQALALIKKCAARVNTELGLLDAELSNAIQDAAQEVIEGRLDDQFPVSIFQTGSGTSSNMNMNEVLASRANEILTDQKGGKSPVHPNDHVNMGQSSNDAIPTAIHVSAMTGITHALVPAMRSLHDTLSAKAAAFAGIRKIGRTHLQDAVPITLGDEFSGYARQVSLGIERLKALSPRFSELALGGTAVGNGLNTHPAFASKVIRIIAEQTRIPFHEAENHFEAQGARDAAVEASGALKTIAVSLVKIANDIRWLGSGPRCGLGELRLPSLQPGSSIMPGKVNPVIPESVIQMAYQVMGNDTTICLCGQSGVMELNVAMPVLAHNLQQSIDLLTQSAQFLKDKCIDGLTADPEKCESFVEQSLALVTAFVPHIGYDRAAELAKKAHNSGKTIREVALEEGILPEDRIRELLG